MTDKIPLTPEQLEFLQQEIVREARRTLVGRRLIGLYGPLMGARVRLGDTSLIAEVEHDCNAYGDECVFSAGLSLRDGLGLSATADNALDAVITNALIIDWTGIYKADIGIKAGRIAGLGKAGNPDSMAGVTPGLVVGANTTVISRRWLSRNFSLPDEAISSAICGARTRFNRPTCSSSRT